MNTRETRKLAVTVTDTVMNRFIKSLKLDAETEDELFHVILDHVNAVGADAYADGVSDATQLVRLHKLAHQIESELDLK